MRAHYRTTKETYILSEDKNKEIICDNPIQAHTKRPPHRAFLQTTCSTQIKLSLYHSLTLHKCVLSVYLSNGQFYYNTFPEKCKHATEKRVPPSNIVLRDITALCHLQVTFLSHPSYEAGNPHSPYRYQPIRLRPQSEYLLSRPHNVSKLFVKCVRASPAPFVLSQNPLLNCVFVHIFFKKSPSGYNVNNVTTIPLLPWGSYWPQCPTLPHFMHTNILLFLIVFSAIINT